MLNNRAQFQSDMSSKRTFGKCCSADLMLEFCKRALVDGGMVKLSFAEEATGVFLEPNRRHAPSGEQLHGRQIREPTTPDKMGLDRGQIHSTRWPLMTRPDVLKRVEQARETWIIMSGD